MASKLEFDPPPPASSGGRRLEFDSPASAGPPSVPISGPQSHEAALAGPSVPISQGNIDTRGMPEDPAITKQKQSEARVQAITRALEAGRAYTPGILDHIADSGTLSTARPISAAVGAGVQGLLNSYPGSTFPERYKAGNRFMNEGARQAEENTPFAPAVGAVASIPASMAATPFKAATAPASTLKVMGQAAVPGFIEGASQNAETLGGAIKGGAKNAALSAGTAGVLDTGMKVLTPAARRGAAAEATAARGDTPDQVRADSKGFFRELDNNGIAWDAKQTAPLYTDLHDLRNRHVYSPRANPGLEDHYNDLLQLTRQGATFNQLHDIRSAIAKQARGPDESTRAAAGEMLGAIDRMVNKAAPAINPNNVNVGEAYGEAKKLWRAASLADDAGWIADKTERRMAVKSGIDPDETTRRNFAAVEQRIDKPGAYDPYSDSQRELLSRIIRGDRGQNMKAGAGDFLHRNANKLGIGAGALTSAAGMTKGFSAAPSVLAASVGLPVTGVANMAGSALKRGAASTGTENVNALLRDITGSPKPKPGDAITRGDLAKIIFAQDLERIAPRVASNVIGEPKEEKKKEKKK